MSTFLFYVSSASAAISLWIGIVTARCGLRATDATENRQEAYVVWAAIALVAGLIAGFIEALV